ncbi:hypothetical protein KY290_022982 [Solanum tuberosum]|uniref:Uncharacterized protein n=1 Tax=Solanum tuberosum TaxID=4113 RepID=A0ABQ7V7P1_SOLTU|nr:hypothetical protein KY284_021876 [Solanum tuberosum]KAH0694673.1 hypothetical protein KY285_021770 [Solanum tuberosum]KAH0759489.1 hypothetical protein KY290_022982 [Solanum tuberosum]
MAANLGKLKIELREAEDNLVKALAENLVSRLRKVVTQRTLRRILGLKHRKSPWQFMSFILFYIEKLKIMLNHRFRFRAPSYEILLFSIPIDPGVPLHMWKWKFEKTSTHLQRMKKVSSTVKSPTLPCQMKEHGMSLDNPGSSLGTFQPPDGITSAIFLSEIDNETIIVATAETKNYEKLS